MEPILPAEKEAMEKGGQGGTRKGDTRKSVELMRLLDEWLGKEVGILLYRFPLLMGCSTVTAVAIDCPMMSNRHDLHRVNHPSLILKRSFFLWHRLPALFLKQAP